MGCEAAHGFCERELEDPFKATGAFKLFLNSRFAWSHLLGLNPYDMSKQCEPVDLEEAVPCSPELLYVPVLQCQQFHWIYERDREMTVYLNRPEVMDLLGVDVSYIKRYKPVSWYVNSDFYLSGDIFRSSVDYVGNLLDRNVSALILAGEYDLFCNWLTNDAWTRAMDWHAKAAFNREDLWPWRAGGEVAGLARSFGGLTFASVRGAGHMVGSLRDSRFTPRSCAPSSRPPETNRKRPLNFSCDGSLTENWQPSIRMLCSFKDRCPARCVANPIKQIN
jgi:hypothetical protein